MAKIHAGVSELKAAHNNLETASKGTGAPAYLLLYYAAECGLKCAQLRRNKLRTTKQLESADHDLHALVKNLKLSASTLGPPPTLRLSKRKSEVCSHSDAHQAWRYGVHIDDSDEAEFVSWLRRICKILKEHI